MDPLPDDFGSIAALIGVIAFSAIVLVWAFVAAILSGRKGRLEND